MSHQGYVLGKEKRKVELPVGGVSVWWGTGGLRRAPQEAEGEDMWEDPWRSRLKEAGPKALPFFKDHRWAW